MKEREKITARLQEFFTKRADNYCLEAAFLYGSWARGLPRIDSDLDVAVIFTPVIAGDEEKFSLSSDIAYKLSAFLNKETNVLVIERDFRHPMLYYNAIVLGEPIFIRNYDMLVTLKIEAITQMEDFCIFGIAWQKEAAKRNLEEISHARF